MSEQYSITFLNKSTNSGNFCVFQEAPKVKDQKVLSLAWLTQMAHPNTKGAFEWNVDYSFVWSETGTLTPGVQFIANEVLPAGLNKNNAVTLAYEDGAYRFVNQTTQSSSDGLHIDQDLNIPFKEASVGVGMSGNSVYAVQAQSNLDLRFIPHSKYYITFGDYTEGQVLDTEAKTNAVEVQFDPGVYSMTVILNEDHTWTIEPTS
ncbi:hypothetical protein [Aneurinibacillus uraniidurans]|uniref:hypothetical protein n=1 Tax=Aneurinibacillus uraniidurans TaxID=2966586 RepID=UPI002349F611|nr:hypothetical protein [Aneurinibacillus sp. B1]WCN36603.1 hypothetical protein PO771_12050 [Aneurinibacillus sp. B1]